MAGNAWTYSEYDNYGALFYWWTHALISDTTFENIKTTCNYNFQVEFRNIFFSQVETLNFLSPN